MMMSWTYKQHTAKPTHVAGMLGMCLWAGSSLSPINTIGGGQRPEQVLSIDSRHIRI